MWGGGQEFDASSMTNKALLIGDEPTIPFWRSKGVFTFIIMNFFMENVGDVEDHTELGLWSLHLPSYRLWRESLQLDSLYDEWSKQGP